MNDDCPHCGSTEGTWFDRSYCEDAKGNKLKYEDFATRCRECGKNVDAPKSYYSDSEEILEVDYDTYQELLAERDALLVEVDRLTVELNKYIGKGHC